MRRLLLLILGFLATWLGATLPAVAAAELPTHPELVHAYTYDTVGSAAPHDATNERGPPAGDYTALYAADIGSSGASASQYASTAPVASRYDRPIKLAQIAHNAGTIERSDGDAQGGSVVVDRRRVAANAGSRLAEASSAAFRAADNVGDFTVSAKHLAGAGGRWNKWAEGVDINGTIANALRSDGATFLPNPGGAADSFIVRTNVGSVIGTKGQTFVKAVISNDGRIITAYPVK